MGWVTDMGLRDVYEWMHSRGRTRGELNTYHAGGKGRRIDHILMSKGLLEGWFGSEGMLETARPCGLEHGHRAVTITGASLEVWFFDGAGRSREWSKQQKAARKLKHTRKAPTVLGLDSSEAYRKELSTRIDWKYLDEQLEILTTVGDWGSELWESRGRSGAERQKVGWRGTLVEEQGWAEHIQDRTEEERRCIAGWEAPCTAQGAFSGRWEEAWGLWGDEVLQAATAIGTEVEEKLGKWMVESTVAASPRPRGPPSRRRFNGWFVGLAEARKGIYRLNRMCGAAKGGKHVVARGMWDRLTTVERLRLAPLREPPATANKVSWQKWLEWASRVRVREMKVLQGQMRREHRKTMGTWVKKREEAFEVGKIKQVLNSVLKRTRGGDGLVSLDTEEGGSIEEPAEVARAVNAHFKKALSGGGVRAWYEEEGVGEGVRTFFKDNRAGRLEREAVLRGGDSEDWEQLPAEKRVFRRMARMKEGVGVSVEEREKMFGNVLRSISVQEWGKLWAAKSKRTSAGKSKVRPDMVKECGEKLFDFLRRLYSTFLKLGLVPDQWRCALVVAIEKVPGVSRLNMLRPLKLLEVCMKAVMSIVKDRLKKVLEKAGLLHGAQMGFRAERSCALAAMKIVTAAEDAWHYRKDLHWVTLDIRKAYDCVVRTLGKGAALRRMGVPMKVVEYLMELDRGNSNVVKTFWDEYLEGTVEAFEAQRGFAQGAAESPLLWDIFYDMVLEELDRQGVGHDIIVDIGRACAGGHGLGAFADDTSVMTNSVEEMRSVLGVVKVVLDLVMLRVAPEKSKHMALMFDRVNNDGEVLMEDELLERKLQHRVELGGVEVPWVEADVGVRHLGYWIDLHLDWGNQQDRIEETIREFTEKVRPARISREILLYVVEAVLVPRVLYPLAVAGLSDDNIRRMEGQVLLTWVLPKLGLHRTYARALLRSSTAVGGLGWEDWAVRVLKVRRRLAMDMRDHSEAGVHSMWQGMRWGHFLENLSGRLSLGGQLTMEESRWEDGVEEGVPKDKKTKKTWLSALDDSLTAQGVKWEDGWKPAPLRWNDECMGVTIFAGRKDGEGELSVEEVATIRKGMMSRDVIWRSELADREGVRIFPWHRVRGWEWVGVYAKSRGIQLGESGGELATRQQMGGWYNQEVQGLTDIDQTVWGEGVKLGTIVRGKGGKQEKRVGIVRAMAVVGYRGTARVEWLGGEWCKDNCVYCRSIGGAGRMWVEGRGKWGCGEGSLEGTEWTTEEISTVTRLWGGEVEGAANRKRAVVVWTTEAAGEVEVDETTEATEEETERGGWLGKVNNTGIRSAAEIVHETSEEEAWSEEKAARGETGGGAWREWWREGEGG